MRDPSQIKNSVTVNDLIMRDILLLTVDSLRADHVSSLGYNRETTPNIDNFAAKGHAFTQAFAHACSTRPSFPSIHTSSHALMHGGFEMMTESRTMLAEVLGDAGYHTGGFHSNLYLSSDFGYDRGFDTFYDSKTDPGFVAGIRQTVKDSLDSEGRLYRFLASAFDTAERRAGINVGSAYDTAERITDRALQWADNQRNQGPRFLWVHYMDVHHPYVPPKKYQRLFRETPITETQSIKLRRKMIEKPTEVTDDELTDIIDLYDAEIRYTDDEIGRLIDEIRTIWDTDPLTIITADHGEEFLDHGKFSHHTHFYDEVLQVPLFLGGVSTSGSHDDIVGLQDVPTTLLDYAGSNQPESFQGCSLRQLINDRDWPREQVIGDWSDRENEERFGFRDLGWKFIVRDSGEELYDLSEDPDEQNNVVTEYPQVVERITAEIDEHRRAISATTDEQVTVEMDENVKTRLRDLGYKE